MAIVCGVPVLNYDVYQFKYPDYKDEKGVLSIQTKGEFKISLNKLINDTQYYRQLTQYQSQSSEKWGTLDGKAGRTILTMFDELVEC